MLWPALPQRVAVVDDESSVRTMLGRVLRMANYEVIAFASGEDFLASLATEAAGLRDSRRAHARRVRP